MKSLLVAFGSGVVFALGLGVSGMTQPGKVIGFLDLAGAWDPSLAVVMVGAIATHALSRRLLRNRPAPFFAPTFSSPTRIDIDAPLVVGAAIFGIGWGMAGFCPGPALTSLASGNAAAVVFVAAMIVGMYVHRIVVLRMDR